MPDSPQRGRYPGLKPFTRSERNLFFGRGEDIERLLTLVKTEPMTVLYSKSGLGKSSLINAGLRPRLEGEGNMVPLVIRFGSFRSADDSPGPLVVVNQTLDQLAPEGDDSLLEKLVPGDTGLWRHMKAFQMRSGSGFDKPICLIFDQFEEIFTYPEDQLRNFKESLSVALLSKIPRPYRDAMRTLLESGEDSQVEAELAALYEAMPVRVLFAIRSDRMYLLNQFKDVLPGILQKTYELAPLSRPQAAAAIENPAQQPGDDFRVPPFTFAEGVLPFMLDYLEFGEQAPDLRKKPSSQAISRSGIESFQLQVLCRHVEDELAYRLQQNPGAACVITRADVGNPREIFTNYYTNLLAQIPDDRQRMLARVMVEDGLIYEEDQSRLTMSDKQIRRDFGVDEQLLALLVNTHLLRREANSTGGFSYEISHDTLVAPILASRAKRMEAKRLQDALKTEKAEQEAERKKTRRRYRTILIGFLIAAAVLLSGLTLWALDQRREAELQERLAISQSFKIQDALEEVRAQRAELQVQQKELEAALAAAQTARDSAELERQRADILRRLAEQRALEAKLSRDSLALAFQDLEEARWREVFVRENAEWFGELDRLGIADQVLDSLAFYRFHEDEGYDRILARYRKGERILSLASGNNPRPALFLMKKMDREDPDATYKNAVFQAAIAKMEGAFFIEKAESFTCDVNGVAFSQVGDWIVAGLDPCKQPFVRNLNTGEERSLPGHQGIVLDAIFLPGQSRYVATAGADSVIRIFDIQTRALQDSFPVGTTVLDLEALGKNLLAVDIDGNLIIWQLPTRQTTRLTTGQTERLNAVATLEDWGIAVGGKDSVLRVFNMKGEVVYKPRLDAQIHAICFSPAHQELWVGCANGAVYKLDLVVPSRVRRAPEQLSERDIRVKSYKKLLVDGKGALSLATDPNGETIYAGTLDGTIGEWDRENESWTYLRSNLGPVSSIAVAPGGGELRSAHYGGAIVTWRQARFEKPGQALAMRVDSLNMDEQMIAGMISRSFVREKLPLNDMLSTLQRPGLSKEEKFDLMVILLERIRDGKAFEANIATLNETREYLAGVAAREGTFFSEVLDSVGLSPGDKSWALIAFRTDSEKAPESAVLATRRLEGDATLRKNLLRLFVPGGSLLPAKSPLNRQPTDCGMYDLAYSPDGSLRYGCGVASKACADIFVFNAEGEIARKFSGHDSAITSLDISPDGKRMASTSFDGNLGIWNLESGSLERMIDMGEGLLFSVRFMDNRRMLVSGDQGRLQIVEGDNSRKLDGHADWVTLAIPSLDRRWIVSADSLNRVIIRKDGEVVYNRLLDHQVWSGELSPDNRFLALGDSIGRVLLMDLEKSPLQFTTIFKEQSPVYPLIFDHSGEVLVFGTQDNSLYGIDKNGKTLFFNADAHVRPVSGIAFHPDNQTFSTVSQWGEILEWDSRPVQRLRMRELVSEEELGFERNPEVLAKALPQAKYVRVFRDHSRPLLSLANKARPLQRRRLLSLLSEQEKRYLGISLLPDGQLSLLASVWELDTDIDINAILPVPDKELFFVATDHGTGKRKTGIYNREGRLVRDLSQDLNGQGVNDLGLVLDKFVVGGKQNGELIFWSLDGDVTLENEGHKELIQDLDVSPEGTRFASASRDDRACYTDLENEERSFCLPHSRDVHAVGLISETEMLAAGDSYQIVRVSRAQPVDTVRLPSKVFGLDVHPEGNEFVAISLDGSYYVFDRKQKDESFSYKVSNTKWRLPLYAVSYSPDGSVIFLGDTEGNLIVIDREGNVLLEHPAHGATIRRMYVDGKNNLLYTCGWDNKVRAWDIASLLRP